MGNPVETVERIEGAEVPGRILVVDDEGRNRALLRDLLELEGHRIIEAGSGSEALERLGREPVDLVLLDVNMPVMDGFEVTRRLRASPATASLPILLVTALAEREQRLEGIAAGANDYVVKPIDGADLRLRVRNALHLRRLHTALAERYDELRRLEQLRDSLVHMIVHDLRSPLAGLVAYLQLIELDCEASGADPRILSTIEEARSIGDNMGEMITNLLDVSRFEAGAMPMRPEPFDLGATVTAAVTGLGGAPVRRRVEIREIPPVDVYGDPVLIRRVLVNLVANALRFSPSDETVVIRATHDGDTVRVSVTDKGRGIAPEFHRMIFDKFGQVAAKESRTIASTGLGLTFCKLAIEAHGGSIGVESEVGRGSTFWFEVPRLGPPPPNRSSPRR